MSTLPTPQELLTIFTVILGILIQVAVLRLPKVAQWYQSLESGKKGTYMIIATALIGIVYYGLSCTTFAVELNLRLYCSKDSLYLLLRTIGIMIVSQQTSYMVLPKYSEVVDARFADE
jgi:hypothetical protein